jgi:hypothetical protein
MKKLSILTLTMIALSSFMATTVLAQNVHLKPPNSEPSFVDLVTLQLSASASLAGLGNGDILVQLTAQANPTGSCTNPAGQTQPPGQNPAPVEVTGSVAIPDSQIKNGNVGFAVITNPPTTPIPGAPDCPNRQWTERITDLAFTQAVFVVEQGGSVVFVLTCDFSPPTANGSVPGGTVTCHEGL